MDCYKSDNDWEYHRELQEYWNKQIALRKSFPIILENKLYEQDLKWISKNIRKYKKYATYSATIAISLNNLIILEIILKAGMNVNKIDGSGCLYRPIRTDAYIRDDWGGWTNLKKESLLHFAIRQNNLSAVKLLLKYGAKNTIDCFHFAIDLGRDEIKRYLCENGANIFAWNFYDSLSCQIYRCEYTHYQLNLWNDGATSTCSITYPKPPPDNEFARYLLDKGVKPSYHALLAAIQTQNLDLVNKILKTNIEINYWHIYNLFNCENKEVIDKVISRSKLHSEDNEYFLQKAASEGNVYILEKLLELKTNINAPINEHYKYDFIKYN